MTFESDSEDDNPFRSKPKEDGDDEGDEGDEGEETAEMSRLKARRLKKKRSVL